MKLFNMKYNNISLNIILYVELKYVIKKLKTSLFDVVNHQNARVTFLWD